MCLLKKDQIKYIILQNLTWLWQFFSLLFFAILITTYKLRRDSKNTWLLVNINLLLLNINFSTDLFSSSVYVLFSHVILGFGVYLTPTFHTYLNAEFNALSSPSISIVVGRVIWVIRFIYMYKLFRHNTRIFNARLVFVWF